LGERDPVIKLQTSPRFKLVDLRHDESITIKGTKTKGLIALLAMAPDYCRSRAWVKQRLWSDRSEEQASGSLRQCISDIKKSLDSRKHLLVTEGTNLALEHTMFCVECVPSCTTIDGAAIAFDKEFLEDLDTIKDPQFRLWLNSVRETHSNQPKVDKASTSVAISKGNLGPFLVIFDKQLGAGLHENVLGSELLTSISKFLLEMPDVAIIDSISAEENPLLAKEVRGCRVFIHAQGDEQKMFIRVALQSIVDGRLLWNDQIVIPKTDDFNLQCFEVLSLTGGLLSQINEQVKNNSDCIDANELKLKMLNKAVVGIFSLDKQEMQSADSVLSNIYNTNPAGQYLAWRAFLRSLAVFQHRDASFLEADLSSTELASEALKASPNESMSLLVTSQFEYLHRGNSEASLHFAKQSVNKNPLNALAWAVLSNTQLVAGQFQEAATSAKRALALGADGPFKHYLEFFACMALSSLKEYDQAAVHAEIALAYSKEFTAPLRYLLPLYKATGQTEKYKASLKRLQELEPDFSLSRYSDADYPVNTLRKIELIDFVL